MKPIIYITEKLKIDGESPCEGCIMGGDYVGGQWHGYHGLLKKWWDHFGLEGRGLIIGEEGDEGEYGKHIKEHLKKTYPKITEVFTASFHSADIIWDITKPLKTERGYDWIICQAVLEHVTDPVSAVKNMIAVIKQNGFLYIHTHGWAFGEHRWPIDCYRFYRDALIAWAELANLEIADMVWSPKHVFVAYIRR